MERVTHLGRPLTIANSDHRVLLVLVAAGAVAGWFRPEGEPPALAMFQIAGTVALAWMLIRELAPDARRSALIGAALAGVAVTYTGRTELAALAALLLTSRILTRSTGLVPLLTDVVVVGVFAGVFARTPLAWAAALALAAAVALDTNHPDPSPDRYMWLAAAIGVAVTVTAVLSGAVDVRWSRPDYLTLVGGLAAWILLGPASPSVASTDDRGGPFSRERIRSARWLALSAATLGTMAGGGAFSAGVWPVWVALGIAGAGARLR